MRRHIQTLLATTTVCSCSTLTIKLNYMLHYDIGKIAERDGKVPFEWIRGSNICRISKFIEKDYNLPYQLCTLYTFNVELRQFKRTLSLSNWKIPSEAWIDFLVVILDKFVTLSLGRDRFLENFEKNLGRPGRCRSRNNKEPARFRSLSQKRG